MFITENKPVDAFVDSDNSFVVKAFVWTAEAQIDDLLYQQIVCKVLRKPTKLISHLQRIYLTYRLGMQEQLYAALVDLLWVLDGKGQLLSRRMVVATQPALSESQVKMLDTYLKKPDRKRLSGNQFSICITGLLGSTVLLTAKAHNQTVSYDPLNLARDYIEYSQLDQALETLETAVLKMPERQDLQYELLDLLKVTDNRDAFFSIRDALLEKNIELPVNWQQVDDYFAGISNEK